MPASGWGLLGAVPGLLLWGALLFWQRRGMPDEGRLVGVVVAVGLICRLAFLFGTPTFYAPDEQPHFKYVQYLAEHQTFPVQSSRTDEPSNDWEYYQPPAYYLLLAPIYAASQALGSTVWATVRILRFFSILLWLITLWFVVQTLDRLGVRDAFVRLFALGLVGLLPTYTFLSAMINNDNLLIALGSGLIYLLVRFRPARWPAWILGGLLGLALLVKLTAVVYVFLVGLLALLALVRQKGTAWAVVRRAAAILALAAALWAPWGWRNWILYGSLTAEEVANIPYAWETNVKALGATVEYMQRSFWAVAGIYNNVGGSYPWIGRVVGYVAGIGLLWGLGWRRARLQNLVPARPAVVVALIGAILVNVGLVLRFGLLYAQGQGRFLFPLLLPLALLLGVGLRMLPWTGQPAMRAHAVGFWSAYALSFVAYSLAVFA